MNSTQRNKQVFPLLLLVLIDFLAGVLFLLPFDHNFYPDIAVLWFLTTMVAGLLFPLFIWLTGGYQQKSLLLGHVKIIQPLILGCLLVVADFWFFALDKSFILNLSRFSLATTGILHLAAFGLIIFSRPAIAWLVNQLKKRGIIVVKSLIIVFEAPCETSFLHIKRYIRNGNHQLLGYFAPTRLLSSAKSTVPYLGNLPEASKYLKEQGADEVVIMGNPTMAQANTQLLMALRTSGAEIKLIPAQFGFLSGLMKMPSLNDVPHIKLAPHPVHPADQVTKQVLNLLVCLPGLVFTAMLFPFIFVVIKSTSRGPLIYRQQRLGKNARPFTLYKFRTMETGAEKEGPQLSSNTDRRITKGGRLLRYWHLDELPQFWNILKGEMSLVGPRPERPHFARKLRDKIPYYKMIYQVKPGLTSLGMVKYGYASTIEQMIDRLYYDLAYINNPSLFTDLKVLGHTLWYIFQKIYRDPKEKRMEKEKANDNYGKTTDDTLQRWIEMKK